MTEQLIRNSGGDSFGIWQDDHSKKVHLVIGPASDQEEHLFEIENIEQVEHIRRMLDVIELELDKTEEASNEGE